MMIYNYTRVDRLPEWESGPVRFFRPWRLSKDGKTFTRMDSVGQIFIVRVDDGVIYYI